jgi:YfiR/HmsC-like
MVDEPKPWKSVAPWLTHQFALAILLAAAVASMILVSASFSVSAQAARPSEAELKAAFLYNFIKFTEWPSEEMANKSEPFVIGMLGKDPLGAVLDKTIEGESYLQKTIVVRRFARMEESVGHSQVLFISSSEEGNLAAILKLLDGHPVLTVSEIENFAQRGGVIKLARESNRIVFEINLDSAKRAGLAMNAQLLKLARIVKR